MNKGLHHTLTKTDIDECSEDTDNCSQNCNNTIGSYQCLCIDGYTLDSDNHTCNGQYMNYCTVCNIKKTCTMQILMSVLVVMIIALIMLTVLTLMVATTVHAILDTLEMASTA